MSGYKKVTVTIGEEEYHRLLEAENRLRFQQSAQSKKRNQNVDKSIQQLYNQVKEMEDRQSQFIKAVSHLDRSIQQVEVDSASQIMDQASAFMNDLEAYKDDFVESTQELVAQQGEYYHQAILQEHADRQLTMLRVQRRLNRAQQSDQQKRDYALEWITTCDQVVQFILHNYRAQLVPSASLEQITQELALAQQNLNNDILDGAILGAQQAYHRLSRMRVELERADQEYTALQQAAVCALETLSQQLDEARDFPAIDLEGNELAEKIPVDVWTNGRLSMLQAEIHRVYQRVLDVESSISLDQMNACINQQIPGLGEQLVSIIHDARKAALSSQLRINIAEMVVQALEGQGFALVEGQYEGNEMKNAFSARLCALDGSQVIVRVVPSRQDLGSNDLYLRNQDVEERTDYELKIRAQEITRTLHDFGLTVHNLQQIPVIPISVPQDSPKQQHIRINHPSGNSE